MQLAAALLALSLSAGGAKAVAPAPALPDSLDDLASAICKVDQLAVTDQGTLAVERVRKRMDALAAVSGIARPFLGLGDPKARVGAHFLLGEAHERFARELLEGKSPVPKEAKDATAAFASQTAQTARQALRAAAANFRSCAELSAVARADAAIGKACAQRVEKLPKELGGGPLDSASPRSGRTAEGRARAVVAQRTPELVSCVENTASTGAGRAAVDVVAKVTTDEMGRVEAVALSPREAGREPLYDCLTQGISLWVFAGVADAELELPLKLQAVEER